MKLKKVGDIQLIASFLVEAGFRDPEMSLDEIGKEWKRLPTEMRAKIAQIHGTAVMYILGHDFGEYPLAEDEYHFLLKRMAREMRVAPTLASIRERWKGLSCNYQYHLEKNHPFMVLVVNHQIPEIYNDPTEEAQQSVGKA